VTASRHRRTGGWGLVGGRDGGHSCRVWQTLCLFFFFFACLLWDGIRLLCNPQACVRVLFACTLFGLQALLLCL